MPGRLVKQWFLLWERILAKAKKVTFPGFDGMALYDVMVFFWRSIVDGALSTRASAIAFSFFMGLFPAIIFLFTLCLLYTSDAADEEDSVDLGGRRIIK